MRYVHIPYVVNLVNGITNMGILDVRPNNISICWNILSSTDGMITLSIWP